MAGPGRFREAQRQAMDVMAALPVWQETLSAAGKGPGETMGRRRPAKRLAYGAAAATLAETAIQYLTMKALRFEPQAMLRVIEGRPVQVAVWGFGKWGAIAAAEPFASGGGSGATMGGRWAGKPLTELREARAQGRDMSIGVLSSSELGVGCVRGRGVDGRCWPPPCAGAERAAAAGRPRNASQPRQAGLGSALAPAWA